MPFLLFECQMNFKIKKGQFHQNWMKFYNIEDKYSSFIAHI